MSIIPFDDRDGVIWFDGTLTPWRDAKIHVLTHALHYASCVFEGERVYGGKVFKLREHSQRLLDSAKILGFEIPLTVAEIEKATNDTVAAMKIVDGYVRPLAWRGAEQMGVSAQQSKIHLAIACWQWPSYFSPEARLKGIRMKFAKWARPAPNTVRRVMPSRKQSGFGVCSSPSMARKTLAPVASAIWPRQSSIRASS